MPTTRNSGETGMILVKFIVELASIKKAINIMISIWSQHANNAFEKKEGGGNVKAG